MLRAYYQLTKPGIVYGNVFTVLAGYLFGSELRIDLGVMFAVLFGMALVIASACVWNNIGDRDIDAKMERTKTRATVTGVVSVHRATVFALVLGVVGFAILFMLVNAITAYVAYVGFFFYVFLYGYAKRKTRTHTLVGSVSGAVPVLAGYTAATALIDFPGWIVFLVMILWQMPHFYAIALYRRAEYEAAGIPLLPTVKGVHMTKVVILAYIAAFIVASTALFAIGTTGYVYLVVVLAFGIAWFVRAIRGFAAGDDVDWAKRLFLFSLQVLIAFSVAISFGRVLV